MKKTKTDLSDGKKEYDFFVKVCETKKLSHQQSKGIPTKITQSNVSIESVNPNAVKKLNF